MNENLERLLPNPFATDYTGKISEESMVDLYTEKELEKFAELIIQDCIEQCYADYDSKEDWDKGVCWAVNQIKEHSGVK